jgi:translation initiation factor eIF-2B subunit epsilon
VHVLADDGQLFHYEESQVFPKRKQASLPKEALGGAKDVRVRVDLESVGVAICSIEVAPLFTENFDYQFFYPDFVNGLLTSDLLGKTICCTVVDPETEKKNTATRSASWAGVVGNTRSYDQVR